MGPTPAAPRAIILAPEASLNYATIRFIRMADESNGCNFANNAISLIRTIDADDTAGAEGLM